MTSTLRVARPALALLAAGVLAGCMTSEPAPLPLAYTPPPPVASDPRYDTVFDDGETIPRLPENLLTKENTRREVEYHGTENTRARVFAEGDVERRRVLVGHYLRRLLVDPLPDLGVLLDIEHGGRTWL